MWNNKTALLIILSYWTIAIPMVATLKAESVSEAITFLFVFTIEIWLWDLYLGKLEKSVEISKGTK